MFMAGAVVPRYVCFSSLSPPRSSCRNPKTSYHCKCNYNSDKTLTQITSSGIIACLRANSAELAMHAARAALDAGVSVLEIVVPTPGFLEVLQHLVREYPTKTIGAGTVLSLKDAKAAIHAGATFLMSPVTVKEILDYVHETEALYIPGAMTPTEIFSAHNSGAKVVKVYPVSALGGVCYIEALQKPFSHIPLVASQGIAIDHIERYITKGASSVVLSDAIFDKEAMLQQNFSTIYQLARLAVLRSSEAVKRMREFS